MVKLGLPLIAATALFVATINAHPGHSLDEEIAERAAYLKHSVRNLDHCAEKLRDRGLEKRSISRRVAKIQQLRDEVAQKKSMFGCCADTPSTLETKGA